MEENTITEEESLRCSQIKEVATNVRNKITDCQTSAEDIMEWVTYWAKARHDIISKLSETISYHKDIESRCKTIQTASCLSGLALTASGLALVSSIGGAIATVAMSGAVVAGLSTMVKKVKRDKNAVKTVESYLKDDYVETRALHAYMLQYAKQMKDVMTFIESHLPVEKEEHVLEEKEILHYDEIIEKLDSCLKTDTSYNFVLNTLKSVYFKCKKTHDTLQNHLSLYPCENPMDEVTMLVKRIYENAHAIRRQSHIEDSEISNTNSCLPKRQFSSSTSDDTDEDQDLESENFVYVKKARRYSNNEDFYNDSGKNLNYVPEIFDTKTIVALACSNSTPEKCIEEWIELKISQLKAYLRLTTNVMQTVDNNEYLQSTFQ